MSPNLNGLRVLVAERGEINMQIFEEVLIAVGVIVETADNGSLVCDKFWQVSCNMMLFC